MKKYIELFKDSFPDNINDKCSIKNGPYVSYSLVDGHFLFTVLRPANNEIWYTTTDNQPYDLATIILGLPSIGVTYNGPKVVSNEYVEFKGMYVMTFDDDVTMIGDIDVNTLTADGPFFMTVPDYGLVCNVESIILPKSVMSIGDNTFYYCAGLTSITIPNGVKSIGNEAFHDCSSLTSITIPNSVTSIGVDAFFRCDSLTSVTIGTGVMSIGDGAFVGCSSLPVENNLRYADAIYLVEADDKTLSTYSIKEGTKWIGRGAFDGCYSLTAVTIPNSVTSIGEWAFGNCARLNSITIPNSVTAIEGWTFCLCSSLTSVTIPNSVTSIGSSAFSSCFRLASITIPNSVTNIGDSVFYQSTNLASIIYNGTTEQWNTITKGNRWNEDITATYVQCTDGQVPLQ